MDAVRTKTRVVASVPTANGEFVTVRSMRYSMRLTSEQLREALRIREQNKPRSSLTPEEYAISYVYNLCKEGYGGVQFTPIVNAPNFDINEFKKYSPIQNSCNGMMAMSMIPVHLMERCLYCVDKMAIKQKEENNRKRKRDEDLRDKHERENKRLCLDPNTITTVEIE